MCFASSGCMYMCVNVCVYTCMGVGGRCYGCFKVFNVSVLAAPITLRFHMRQNKSTSLLFPLCSSHLSLLQVVLWSRGVVVGASWRMRPSCGFGQSRTPSNLVGCTRKEEECPPCLGATGRCAGLFCGSRSSCTLRTTAKRSWKEPSMSAKPS